MVQECASRFSSLAAGPLSAARGRALAPAFLTASPKTRVGGSRRCASGQHPRRRRQRAINAPGLRACGYKTVSGRRKFLNPDPIGFSGGLNFYAYANGNPVSYLDPFGLSGWSATGRFLEGAAIGAGVAVVVVLAAPEVVAGGAAALVWAGVSEATATTVASATVTVGLTATAGVGTYATVVNTAQNAGAATVTGNWDPVAYNAGTLTGGFLVGVSGGGRALAEGISGQPTSALPGLFGDSSLGYDPNYPGGSALTWLGSGPTPQSGIGALIPTAAGAGLFFQPSGTPDTQQGSWLPPTTLSIGSSLPSSTSQSSSTGK